MLDFYVHKCVHFCQDAYYCMVKCEEGKEVPILCNQLLFLWHLSNFPEATK